jgi:hypothetical protein
MQVHRSKEFDRDHFQPEAEGFHVEDFMFPDLMKPGLGRVCDYCNISKGRSMIFSSMDQYADHWYENHKEFSIYAFPEDLDKFSLQFKRGYQTNLKKLQKQHTLDPEQAEYIHEYRLQKKMLLKSRNNEQKKRKE